ncbi:MAG: exosortase/archaeosortase family protein [Verrucomicrobia bacterium]|nr:exosortase/archaeosortase family protein [Verrucomicrobiota bacterium]
MNELAPSQPVKSASAPNAGWSMLVFLLPTWGAVAWLVSKAQWFWNHRPDLQFGWVVLLLSAFLVWEAWEKKPASSPRWRWWSVAAAGFGLVMLFVVQIYQAAFGTTAATLNGTALGVLALIAANLGYLFGWPGIRHFGFGFAFLLIALPMPSVLYENIVSRLQSDVAYLNVEALNLLGIPARRVGSLIQLSTGTVGIDEACSGIRSLQSTVMATLFIGYLSLRNRALQGVLLLSGILLAIFGNFVRSFFLSYTAHRQGMHAVESFHDAAGWSILAFTAVGVILLSMLFHRLEIASRRASVAKPVPANASV